MVLWWSVTLCLVCLTSATAANGVGNEDESKLPLKDDSPVKTGFDKMSVAALQVLMDIRDGFSRANETAAPMPLYRLDLDHDYIAYWEVASEADFVIISAGPNTGDSHIVTQSQRPTRTEQVQALAEAIDQTCFKYFLINFKADLVCANEEGQFVATSLQWDQFSVNNTEELPMEDVLQLLQNHQSEMSSMWAERATETSSQWQDELVMTETELNDWLTYVKMVSEGTDTGEETDTDEDNEQTFRMVNEICLKVGDEVKIALSNSKNLRFVEIVALADFDQEILCQAVQVCDNTTKYMVDGSAVTIDHETGVEVLEFEIQLIEGNQSSIDFALVVHRGDDEVVLRQYSIDFSHQRQKRRTQYTSWSRWTTYDIRCPHLFPSYTKHRMGRCSVGSGPVAWAMIFGYLDRASHAGCRVGGKALWRCGYDGFSGRDNTCQAPPNTTPVVTRYTEKLHDEMGTWCIGATTPGRMPKVERFFRARQVLGRIVYRKPLLPGFISASTAAWARDRLREGWPVVVGHKISIFNWHYPVAVGYRVRSRSYRRCLWRWCFRWKTEFKYEMKLNMGRGGDGNGYYNMRVFFGGAGVY